DACREEREERARVLVASLGDPGQEDPLTVITSRVDEMRALEQRASKIADAAVLAQAAAAEARREALSATARGAALVGSLRALRVAALAGRGFDLPPALVQAVPSDPMEAASVARSLAGAATELTSTIAAESADLRARLKAEMEQARDSLPEG